MSERMSDQELRQLALKMAIEASIVQCQNGDAKAMFNDILMKRVDSFYRFLSARSDV